jgi:hypothetical protein
MRISEVFKTNSEEERRKSVTGALIAREKKLRGGRQ